MANLVTRRVVSGYERAGRAGGGTAKCTEQCGEGGCARVNSSATDRGPGGSPSVFSLVSLRPLLLMMLCGSSCH